MYQNIFGMVVYGPWALGKAVDTAGSICGFAGVSAAGFQDHPVCEADNLELALLSYADLDGSVPATGTDEAITVANAYVQYCQREHPDNFITRFAEPLLREMAAS